MSKPTHYLMRPEWAAQQAVLLAWPHISTDWAFCLTEIHQTYIELVSAISEAAIPLVLCQDADHQSLIIASLPNHVSEKCLFEQMPYNDTWCRDYGPITLMEQVTGTPAQLLDFSFTGWGNKYDAQQDNAANHLLAERKTLQLPMQSIQFDLEGGGIETDGAGTLLTTQHCFLNSERNPDLTPADIELKLKQHLGVDRVLWLKHGLLIGDDTDSHVDNLARFINEDTIVYASAEPDDTAHYQPLRAMAEELREFKTKDGQPYNLIPLPIPSVQIDPANGNRLPGSYVNFLILNDLIIASKFNVPQDAVAAETLAKAFPNKRVKMIDGTQLIRQFGGPHCATMQLPPGTLSDGRKSLPETQLR